jgi:hypothetical protein
MVDAALFVSVSGIIAQMGNLLLPSSAFDCCKLFFRHPVASGEVALYPSQPYQGDGIRRKGN